MLVPSVTQRSSANPSSSAPQKTIFEPSRTNGAFAAQFCCQVRTEEIRYVPSVVPSLLQSPPYSKSLDPKISRSPSASAVGRPGANGESGIEATNLVPPTVPSVIQSSGEPLSSRAQK